MVKLFVPRWRTEPSSDQSVQRFGGAEVGQWWLEVWNEPNMSPFWSGSFDQYLDLYRATSEAVQRSGHAVRIGGPAVAYMPDEGAGLVKRFLDFLHREPAVKCDFISLHRKGIWTNQEAQPDLQCSVAAARHTAQAALRIDAGRFRGMPIINNEADMKVAFNTPYEPRMTEQFASWLMAQTIAYDQLSVEFSNAGFRFRAASDNANQQLIREPFDGRRSIPQGELRESFHLQTFATVLVWATPFVTMAPGTPQRLQTETVGSNVILRWTPNNEPWFYSYELRRHSPGSDTALPSPIPLRAATWADCPPPGRHVYQLCAVSASGIRSEIIMSREIVVSP
ncbi:MAG: GH39 family glycosyl hydrolase [Rhodopila sp.]